MSAEAAPLQPLLSIGELARRTGVEVSTLRMWEVRHGFPQARRLPSGHRRYDPSTVQAVQRVLEERARGRNLRAAVAEAKASPADLAAPSVHADVRRKHPALTPYLLRKRTLTALSHALEDEFCARAERPFLFAGFQTERFYRQSRSRWRDLAATARGAWVFAEFGELPGATSAVEVALPSSAPLRREWVLVCLSEDYPACLSAWELPGQEWTPDRNRAFECVWSVDPLAVADAARACVRIATDLGHDLSEVAPLLATGSDRLDPQLARATNLFNRVVAYVDRAADRPA